MGYSESVFDVAADIVYSAEISSTDDPKKVFEDLVIALSIDTGLTRKDARGRLAELIPNDYDLPRLTPI
ncbi:hypothetical protein A8B78_20415 [Jannaschia sp. EhC01]|nr:hypothetical protein A8B78_20415 [Jannaschia sp. EhC01]